MSGNQSRFLRWIGPLLGGLALLAYFFTLSRGAFPGQSAHLVVEHAGLDPFASSSSPLWGFAVWVLGRLPLGSLMLRLNLFSALCAALVVALFCRVMVRAVLGTIEIAPRNRAAAMTAAALAAITGGLFLAFSVPFWSIANRAHSASFDLLLLLIVTDLFVGLVKDFSFGRGMVFGLLYGLGTVEFATFIVLAPLFAIGLLYALWKQERLEWKPLLPMLAC